MKGSAKWCKGVSVGALAVLLMLGFAGQALGNQTREFVYVAHAGGVSAFTIDSTTGALTLVAGSPFLSQAVPQDGNSVTVDPSGKFVYLTNADAGGGPTSAVVAYTVDSTTGALTLVPGSPFPAGTAPFSVAVHPSGKFAYAANFTSNDVSAYTIDSTTGALSQISGSPFPDPQPGGGIGPTPISVAVDPSGKFAYVANYLLFGGVMAYTIDNTTGALSAVPGSPFRDPRVGFALGPIHVAVHPSGKFLYVAYVFGDSVSAFTIDSTTGGLTPISGSPFATPMPAPGLAGSYSVALDPSGKFAYVPVFHANGIAAYTIDSASGALSPVSGSPFAAGIPNPFSAAVDPSGKFVYVVNGDSINNVFAFTIDSATGALSPVSGSPFSTGGFNPTENSAAIAVASEVTSPTCVAPPSGMVSWWPGDGNASDIIGSNNGTLLGTVSFAAAEVGQGFIFASDADGVTIPHNPSLDVNSPGFTADFWMKGIKNQPGTASTMFEKSHGWVDSTGWAFQVDSPGGAPSFAIGDGVGFPQVIGTVDVLDGGFHLIAGTWDGTTGEMRLYVDGVLQGTATNLTPANNTRPVNMGFTWGGGTPRRFFRGTLDELEVYNRALSASEIQSIFNAGSAGKCKTPQQATQSIINAVSGLGLNSGVTNSLIVKLQAAIHSMNEGNNTAARNQLQAFINEVNALVNSGKLSASQGQALIDAANKVIARIP